MFLGVLLLFRVCCFVVGAFVFCMVYKFGLCAYVMLFFPVLLLLFSRVYSHSCCRLWGVVVFVVFCLCCLGLCAFSVLLLFVLCCAVCCCFACFVVVVVLV